MVNARKLVFVALVTCLTLSTGLMADSPEPVDGFAVAYNVPACSASECDTCNRNGYGCIYSEGTCYCSGEAPEEQ